MKNKIIITSIFCIFMIINVNAQDIIFKKVSKKYSQQILSKIIKVTDVEIKFKLYDDLDGPEYTYLVSEVTKIKYENGETIYFNDQVPLKKENNNISTIEIERLKYLDSIKYNNMTDEELYNLGKQDASKYYKAYKVAGTSLLIWGAIPGYGIMGILPTIIISSVNPNEENFIYPTDFYQNKYIYKLGYANMAKKIKKRKVWTNWLIGFGVNVGILSYIFLPIKGYY